MASSTRKQARPAWNAKVQLHYQRLLGATRTEGLWRMRQVALWLRQAGIDVHTGTVPVERMWSTHNDMFPRSARRMGLKWFGLLANLAYLRDVYRHFHVGVLPPWAEDDALAAEAVENLVYLLPRMESGEGSSSSLDSLFEPFT